MCCLTVVKAAGSRTVGAAVRKRLPRADMDDRVCWAIELFDFTGRPKLVDTLLSPAQRTNLSYRRR